MALPALVGTNDPTEVAHADSGCEEDLGRWFGCIPNPLVFWWEKSDLFQVQ